jgi:electron transport complex protein RnfD
MAQAVIDASADGTTVPSVLGMLASGAPLPSRWAMFLGTAGGNIGEVCAPALLIGFIWLLFRRITGLYLPLSFLGSALAVSLLLGLGPSVQLLAGSMRLGALFMAQDPVTTPVMPSARIVFGVCCGVITMIIRRFGTYEEGVHFAILLMNIATPHIDRITAARGPKRRGGREARR